MAAMCPTSLAQLILLELITILICCEEWKLPSFTLYSLLRPHISELHIFVSARYFFNMRDRVSRSYKTTGKNYSLDTSIFCFSEEDRKEEMVLNRMIASVLFIVSISLILIRYHYSKIYEFFHISECLISYMLNRSTLKTRHNFIWLLEVQWNILMLKGQHSYLLCTKTCKTVCAKVLRLDETSVQTLTVFTGPWFNVSA